jgi:hypothetical protein
VAGLLLLPVLPAGCVNEPEEDCPPVARLVYRYNQEGESGGKNVLPVFVSRIIQYIFDENERLVAVDTVRPDDAGRFVSRRQLAPGHYTVSGWGNVKGASRVKAAVTGREMELYLDNETGDGVQGDSERLFYGYREFTVEEQGESLVHVDMTRAHCSLSFTIWWRDAARAPAGTGDFYLVLRDIPSQYGFFPGYHVGDDAVINYIPVVHDEEQLVTRRVAAGMLDKTLRAGLVSYRLTGDSHPVLSVHDGEKVLVGEIDLHEFFVELGIRLDEVLKQEYLIGIEIGSDRVVAFLLTASVSEWSDGKL